MNVGCKFQSSEKFTREAFILDLADRAWQQSNTRSILIDSNDTRHMYSDSDTKFKDYKNIPEHVLPYYEGINVETYRNPARRGYTIVLKEPAKKFEINGRDAFKFACYIADNMPENVGDLSPETVNLFLDVINKEKGYDLSIIFIIATKLKSVNDYWSHHFEATNYIAIDRFMNPINVDAFLNVMKKIVVKK